MSFCDHLHSFPCSWMIVVDKMAIYNFRMKVCVNVFLIPYDKIETLRMKMNSLDFARKRFLTEKCWDKFQKIQQDSCQSSRSFIIILICSTAIEIMAFRDIWTYYFFIYWAILCLSTHSDIALKILTHAKHIPRLRAHTYRVQKVNFLLQ